jgi:hypothetical protein
MSHTTVLTPTQLTDLLNFLLIKPDYSAKVYYRIPVPVIDCEGGTERWRAERWCDERLTEGQLAPRAVREYHGKGGRPHRCIAMPPLVARVERTLPASWSNYRYM